MTGQLKQIGWVFLAGLAGGAIVWGLSVPMTGMREPFDSPGHYYVVAMFAAGIVAALPAPRFFWVAVVGIFLGERVYAFVMLPETRSWLLPSILINLAVLTWLPAAAGALSVYLAHRWLPRQR